MPTTQLLGKPSRNTFCTTVRAMPIDTNYWMPCNDLGSTSYSCPSAPRRHRECTCRLHGYKIIPIPVAWQSVCVFLYFCILQRRPRAYVSKLLQDSHRSPEVPSKKIDSLDTQESDIVLTSLDVRNPGSTKVEESMPEIESVSFLLVLKFPPPCVIALSEP